MFMSPVAVEYSGHTYPDLAGARVLITGLTSEAGVDVARAFAEHKTRLILQSPETSSAMTELGAVLAESTPDIQFFNDPIRSGDDAVQLAQRASQVYGGLEAVINIARANANEPSLSGTYDDVEDYVSSKLLAPTLISRVTANRMRLMMTEGSILNVVSMPAAVTDRQRALAGVMRAALATLTRGEATDWARDGIRINGIGPRGLGAERSPGAVLTSDPDIAVLALHLASKKGKSLAGYLFDAELAAA